MMDFEEAFEEFRTPRVCHKMTKYAFVIDKGSDHGISKGDTIIVWCDGRELVVEVHDVGPERATVERLSKPKALSRRSP